MIRYILLGITLFGICNIVYSQSTVIKYCEMEAYHTSGFTSVFTIKFIPGNVDSLFSFKDSGVVNGLKKLDGLKSIPDAFNLLSEQGWTFVALVPTASGGPILFYFKKEFDRKELNYSF